MAHHVDQAAVLRVVLANDGLTDLPQAERAQAVPLVLLGADGALDLGHLELCHYCTLPAACARARSMPAGATSSMGRPRRAATSSGRCRHLESRNGGVHDVDGVVATERLGRMSWTPAHSSTARTAPPAMTPVPGAGRTQHDDAGRGLTLNRVRDGAADHRDAEEALASLLDTLLDGRGNFLGLAVADADQAVAVADDHEGGEAEATTTLDDLGDAVDRDYALEVVRLLGGVAATPVATATTVASSRPPRLSPPAAVGTTVVRRGRFRRHAVDVPASGCPSVAS